MMGITRKQFIKYSVLPGFRPRMRELFVSGFHHIPLFMALVYEAVRLLPAGHPYTNPANMGRFGVRHVIAEAANNLVISRKNIDQLILFVTLLVGVVIVLVQLCLFFFSLVFQPALAANIPTNFAGFFITPNPQQDLAYILLDLIFGVPGVFGNGGGGAFQGSCVAMGVLCMDADFNRVETNAGISIFGAWPFPIHTALHQMFQIYSTGLLVVGAFIALYFMTAVVAETAQTGTPFGKRFNKVWAPLRIVTAFGLLVPVGFGLNASQYIVLYAAKYGSGFATNGWILFNTTLDGGGANVNYLGPDGSRLVARPNAPEVGRMLQFLYQARICAEFEQLNSMRNPDQISLIRPPGTAFDSAQEKYVLIPYAVRGPQAGGGVDALPLTYTENAAGGYTPYNQLVDFANGSTQVTIRIGIRDKALYPKEKGHVSARCGEMTFNLMDPRDPASASNPPEPGPAMLQHYYWYALQELWYCEYGAAGNCNARTNYARNTVINRTSLEPGAIGPLLPEADQDYKAVMLAWFQGDLNAMMDNPAAQSLGFISGIGAIEAQGASNAWLPGLDTRGWAAAGIWYNKIAELNGSIMTAVLAVPTPSRWPEVMEYILDEKMQQDQDVSEEKKCSLKLANNLDIQFLRPEDAQLGKVLCDTYKFWEADGQTSSTHTSSTGNPVLDGISAFLGTDGLFSMRRNADVHPLAQLVGIGRSLIESAIRSTVLAGAATVVGIPLKAIDQFPAKLTPVAISMLMMIATIGLSAGFVLFYIVPFLPFIYFFFAVGGWLKAIFEAMVGAPLWALAHIRIDGHGLPGQAAVNGYYLIFEIFLRPILIVFGLLASISIFAALVSTLNMTWDLVTANLGGFNAKLEIEGTFNDQTGAAQIITPALNFMRGPVDEFFYTVTYAIIVYLVGMSSFKLIDLIPNNILRWMGQQVMTFNDQREDSAQGMVGTASVGAQQGISALGKGLGGAMHTVAGPK